MGDKKAEEASATEKQSLNQEDLLKEKKEKKEKKKQRKEEKKRKKRERKEKKEEESSKKRKIATDEGDGAEKDDISKNQSIDKDSARPSKDSDEVEIKENSDQSVEKDSTEPSRDTDELEIKELEQAYKKALAAFKADKSNKDLRRAKSAAKKAWDDKVIASAGPGAEPLTCRNCSQLFIFKDQDKFEERSWEKPIQCKKCTFSVSIQRSHTKNRAKRDEKQNMCYDFQKTGRCSRGDRCKFSHSKEHVGKKRMADMAARDAARPLCVSIEKGEPCPHGDRCRFRHEKSSTDDAVPKTCVPATN